MSELRLPRPSSSASLQLLLTRALESLTAYLHASRITRSQNLRTLCDELADERNQQVNRIAAMIEHRGGTPDFGVSREADFLQIWMSLVDRRLPDPCDGLPRECEREDRGFEKALLELWNEPTTDDELRHDLADILRQVRAAGERLHTLRDRGLRMSRSAG